MKTILFTPEEGGTEAWMNYRLGRLTGSKLRDTLTFKGSAVKDGYYQLIAESALGSLILAEDDMRAKDWMERGKALEKDALKRFNQLRGKKFKGQLVAWEMDDENRISVSPDAVGAATEAAEFKCLCAAKHTEAFLTQEIPTEHRYQAKHYFVVNKKLKKLYFGFYHPDFAQYGKDFFCIEMNRKDFKDEIAELEKMEREVIGRVREDVNKIIGF